MLNHQAKLKFTYFLILLNYFRLSNDIQVLQYHYKITTNIYGNFIQPIKYIRDGANFCYKEAAINSLGCGGLTCLKDFYFDFIWLLYGLAQEDKNQGHLNIE